MKQLNGMILPEVQDIIIYNLIQAKSEATYMSNAQIADAILLALPELDAEDVANRILEAINER